MDGVYYFEQRGVIIVKIGYRTIKTAIATPVAIWIAEMLQLDNAVSAGILAILCIQPTRKTSVLSAWHRMGACLLAILFSAVLFEVIGYNPVAIGILLLLFIPATVRFQLTPGIVSSSVIILHLYAFGNISMGIILNELGIISIGIGLALMVNLYMPSLENNLKQLQEQLEDNFRMILLEIAVYLKEGRETWTGKEFTETEKILDEAEILVAKDVENHLLRGRHPYYEYFLMRRKQFELLRRMLPLVSQMKGTYEQSYKMGDFFTELADAVNPRNTAKLHLQTLAKIRMAFSEDELPQTRQEFETRANLFRLLHEIEQYLVLKKTFKKSDV